MDKLEIKGQVVAILPLEQGITKAGKDWQKLTIIIEFSEGNYQKKLALSATKEELIKTLQNLKQGDSITASINLESREFNGKWFNSVNVWKVVLG
jgi:hypothetical protein